MTNTELAKALRMEYVELNRLLIEARKRKWSVHPQRLDQDDFDVLNDVFMLEPVK